MGKLGPDIFPLPPPLVYDPPPTKFDHHQILAWVEKSIGNSINHTHQAMY